MEVKFTRDFEKRYRKSPVKIRKAFDVRLGRFLGYRSINITGDWRAVYKEKTGVVHFVELGTHSQLYK